MGGRKTESEATQITADINKFLKFAHPETGDPIWLVNDLLDSAKASAYLDYLEVTGACGPAGQLTKLDCIQHGIRYICLKLSPSDAELVHRCNIMEEQVKRWKSTIRPARKLQQQLKEDTQEQVNLKEAVAILQSEQLKWDVKDITSRAATGSHLKSKDLKLIVSAVVTMLLYRSWQRPGAVTNAMMAEFEAAQMITDDNTGKIMMVAHHKTAWEGPVPTTMTKDNYCLLQNYVNHICPQCKPARHSVFAGVQGNVIKQPKKYIQWLGREYGQKNPCCTYLRQVGGTEAGLQCDEPALRLISHQMSHSQSAHYKHYEKLGGQKKAATALQVRQRLAFGNKSEESDPKAQAVYSSHRQPESFSMEAIALELQ